MSIKDITVLLQDVQEKLNLAVAALQDLQASKSTSAYLQELSSQDPENNICSAFDNLLNDQDSLNELINQKREASRAHAQNAQTSQLEHAQNAQTSQQMHAQNAQTSQPTQPETHEQKESRGMINNLYKLSKSEREELLEQIYLKAVQIMHEKHPNLSNEELEPLVIKEADNLLKMYL